MKTFTYVIAPEGTIHLVAGKRYNVLRIDRVRPRTFFIFEYSKGDNSAGIVEYDPALDGKKWIIPEIDQWPEGWTRHQKAMCLQKAGVEILTSGFMQIIGEEKPYEKGVTTCASTDEYQGRTPQQLEGSYKIMNTCFIALFVLIILAAIFI